MVRELGQPELAQAFAQGARREPRSTTAAPPVSRSFTFSCDESPTAVARRLMRAYSEHAVFSRDLVSAQRDGLLLLAGLDTPRSLARAVLEVVPGQPLWTDLAAWCAAAGQGLVVDGPEWQVSAPPAVLQLAALAQRSVVVNLNAAQPPSWARQRGAGPLFADEANTDMPSIGPWVDAMDEARSCPRLRWDWHLQAHDFTIADRRRRLGQVARHALDGRPIAFVFDRPRRPVVLAEGMDRERPAVLMEIGLDLAAFLRLPGIAGDGEAFHQKLASLARMAVSAGAQKRKYLRRHAEGTHLGRGFLLDRARLAVVPLGLDAIVRSLSDEVSTATAMASAPRSKPCSYCTTRCKRPAGLPIWRSVSRVSARAWRNCCRRQRAAMPA